LTITISIAKQIFECEKTWDNFLPQGHHLQSRHLLALEQSNIEDLQPNYVEVFLKDKLIGLVYLQQFRFQHKHVNFKEGNLILSESIKCILPRQVNLLVCGHLFRINFQGFYFKNPAHQHFIFDAIELFNQKEKKTKPAGIMLKDCNDIFVEQGCKLSGYQFFNGDVTMEISRRPGWQSFDDYIKDLNKKYAQRARKLIRSFQGIEQRELDAAAILEQAAPINKLYWNVVQKQTIKLGIVNARYFYELKQDLQENFELHALYQGATMVGFYTFIFYEKEMETHYIGLEYEVNKTANIYFNILFLATAKMIERQYDKLELGRTARDAKISLGAVPKQIFNYINIKNPIARITLQYFLKKFNNTENQSMVQRSPLK
jgi:hypothetical protein